MLPSIFGENLFDDFFTDPFSMIPSGRDVLYGKHGKKDEINVEIADGYLTIQASKGLDKDQQDKDGKYIRQERYAGSCSRSFYIGEDVPAEDISAKYEDGILRLSVPKADQKELPKTSTIAIE